MFVAFGLLRRALLQRNSRFIGQQLQGGDEIQPVVCHYEVENVAALAASAKTAPVLAIGKDDEGRRFLGVERAKPGVVAPGLLELNILRQEVDDVKPRFDLVGDRHSWPPVTSCKIG